MAWWVEAVGVWYGEVCFGASRLVEVRFGAAQTNLHSPSRNGATPIFALAPTPTHVIVKDGHQTA
jgi:hypothetical protein